MVGLMVPLVQSVGLRQFTPLRFGIKARDLATPLLMAVALRGDVVQSRPVHESASRVVLQQSVEAFAQQCARQNPTTAAHWMRRIATQLEQMDFKFRVLQGAPLLPPQTPQDFQACITPLGARDWLSNRLTRFSQDAFDTLDVKAAIGYNEPSHPLRGKETGFYSLSGLAGLAYMAKRRGPAKKP